MSGPRLSSAEVEERLAALRRDYEAAKAALHEVGFICEGSLAEVYHCCKKPNCRCADPERRHGPYFQLTWKQAGKTVTRRLSAEQARLYRDWIANRRRLEAVIDEMHALSRRAGQYLMAELGQSFEGPEPARRERRSTPQQPA